MPVCAELNVVDKETDVVAGRAIAGDVGAEVSGSDSQTGVEIESAKFSLDDDQLVGWVCDPIPAARVNARRRDSARPVAFLVSIVIHAALLAFGFALFKSRYFAPSFVFKQGGEAVIGGYVVSNGTANRDPIPEPRNSESGGGAELAPPPPAVADDRPAEQPFAKALAPRPVEPTSEIAPIGVSDSEFSAVPKFRERTKAVKTVQPSQSTAPPAVSPIANAAPRRSVRESASHISTPPHPLGNGGTSATAGARDGLDDRGLPLPEYPAISRRRGEQGLVELEVRVRPDGTIERVIVLKDAGFPRLAIAASRAIQTARLAPATFDGQPVAGRLVIPYRFVLK